jgi:hypothetical protein
MVHHRIPVPNTGFRSLLLQIARVYRGREFTSNELAGRLRRLKYRPKYVSNALRRLFFMGLVQRRRCTRVLFRPKYDPKTDMISFLSPPLRRGVEYRYRLGRRGAQYVEWLRKTQPMREAARQQLQREIGLGRMIGLERYEHYEHSLQSSTSKAPAGQPGFVDNPSAAVLAMWEWNREQQRQNDQVQLELSEEFVSQWKRANQAEKKLYELTSFLVIALLAGIISIDRERYDRAMKELAKTMPWLRAQAHGENSTRTDASIEDSTTAKPTTSS